MDSSEFCLWISTPKLKLLKLLKLHEIEENLRWKTAFLMKISFLSLLWVDIQNFSSFNEETAFSGSFEENVIFLGVFDEETAF